MQKRNGKTIIKILTPAYCPITKASNNSHFHSSHFFALYFPSQYQWFFFSLLPFLVLEIKNNCAQIHYTTRTAPGVIRFTKLNPVLRDLYLDGWPKTNTPRSNNFIFFHSLSKTIFKTVELPSLVWCRSFYFSTICSSFRHVRIRVYILIQYRTIVQINSQTRRSNSSQFSWLLVV